MAPSDEDDVERAGKPVPYDAELDRTDAVPRPPVEESTDDAADGDEHDERVAELPAVVDEPGADRPADEQVAAPADERADERVGDADGDESPGGVSGAVAAIGRFARRARTKPAQSDDEREPIDAEVAAADESAPVERRIARRPEPPKPLISGDPLLTGPMPVTRPDPPRPIEQRATERTEAEELPAPQERTPERPDPRDLLAPIDAPVSPTPAAPPPSSAPPSGPGVPPRPASPPPSTGTAGPRVAPPPPPAPSVSRGPVPPGQASPSQPARRASRGAQVTGRQTVAPTSSVDSSGPVVVRQTAVAPAPQFAGRRPRVRRVTRVVRHVDPWSVFKVAAVFSFVAYGIALVAGVLLWNVAYATGTIDNIERGMESTGWETFELKGGEIFHNAWIAGLFIAVGLTGAAVLVATLFNLVTDLVGGLRFTVLEEEVIEKTASPMRRFAGRRPPEATGPTAPQPRRR